MPSRLSVVRESPVSLDSASKDWMVSIKSPAPIMRSGSTASQPRAGAAHNVP